MKLVQDLVVRHLDLTGSPRAAWILDNWTDSLRPLHQSFSARAQAGAGSEPPPSTLYPEPAARRRAAGRAGAAWVKTTGFLEYARELAPRRPVTQRVNDWFEIYLDFPEDKSPHPGCALHGLRRAFLPDRMSRQQSHSRLERSRLSRALERSRAPAPRNQQFSGIYRPHLSRAVRSVVCARNQSASGHHQADRKKYR